MGCNQVICGSKDEINFLMLSRKSTQNLNFASLRPQLLLNSFFYNGKKVNAFPPTYKPELFYEQ